MRALRHARFDPLYSPDEPLAVTFRPYSVRPGERGQDVVLVLQRELSTFAEAKAALARALGGDGGRALSLVIGGARMDDDKLLWDAGVRATGPAVYFMHTASKGGRTESAEGPP